MSTDDHVAIAVNGEPKTLPLGSTLPDLLTSVSIDPATVRGIAVAVNEEIVRRQGWQEVTLKQGDRVEIVTANQGG